MSKNDEKRPGHGFLTRREFFSRPLSWFARQPSLLENDEEIAGRIPLSSLDEIPVSVLMGIVPVLRRGWTAHNSESGISYQDPAGQNGMVYLSPEGCSAARLFDGTRTLKQAARVLEKNFDMSFDESATVVCEAFLTLAMREVYHPDGPLQFFPLLPKEKK